MRVLAYLIGLALVPSAQPATLIAQLRTGSTAAAVAQTHGVTVADVTAGAPFVLFAARPGADLEALQARMALDARLLWVEDNAVFVMPEHEGAGKGSTVAAIGDRNALYGLNTGLLSQIRWTPALANASGRTVKVAVLDTGLAPRQPALWSRVAASLNAVENGQPAHDVPRLQDTDQDGELDEGVGHGTMVAGLVDQISPKSSLIIARVLDSDGYGSAWTLIKGLAFAVVRGAEVINVSVGSQERVPAVSDVLDWVEARGALVVAAIGNNGVRKAMTPATISKVVCVAGVAPDDRKAPFSNWDGKTLSCAPATGVRSAWWTGEAAIWSGTSFAAPLVSGSIAEGLRRRASRLSPSSVRRALRDAGDDINGRNSGYRNQLGRRLNCGTIMNALRNAP